MVSAAQVKSIAGELGVGFLTLGFDPKTHLEDVPIMPKGRYRFAIALAVTEVLAQGCSFEISTLALRFSAESLPHAWIC